MPTSGVAPVLSRSSRVLPPSARPTLLPRLVSMQEIYHLRRMPVVGKGQSRYHVPSERDMPMKFVKVKAAAVKRQHAGLVVARKRRRTPLPESAASGKLRNDQRPAQEAGLHRTDTLSQAAVHAPSWYGA
ncbi:hypothetical protein BAUCODRAFT_194119 [Baudoinia panamericana UAMH 10762]|uniref:Uncharacterized protein n=1 Tax=Baudoinia panamericana (strain UAMH 10762) TaxID=717646 RepID=M2NPZ0_BAUPA|nr:uncharacterized protein BAUCODRAFT_194119 [Baudoinia panamericana UAMH 10762]EMD01056.1 hypothetical protein BAUCODRAFT_194119 [Baudoinia panamericana UAMH 10762]